MRRYAVFLVAAPVALVCVRLGFWQLSRLSERRALNESRRAAMALPPIQLEERPAPAQVDPYRSVRAAGTFDFSREVVISGRNFGEGPAAIVVTPLMLAGDTAVLVERGWIRAADPRRVGLDSLRETASVILDGIVVDAGPEMRAATDTGWPKYVQRANPRALGPEYPYPLLAYLVRRTAPPEGGQLLRPVPVPELSEGPHLAYAVQWFAFATIILVGSVALYRKEVRQRRQR
jgi:surfeit locus 1 family protein